jgi:hypothetical protein
MSSARTGGLNCVPLQAVGGSPSVFHGHRSTRVKTGGALRMAAVRRDRPSKPLHLPSLRDSHGDPRLIALIRAVLPEFPGSVHYPNAIYCRVSDPAAQKDCDGSR